METRDAEMVMRIGEVAERAGIAVPTLRSWERRYGLLDPQRSPGGHRMYRAEDLARVLAVRDLIARGWQARDAAQLVLEGRVPDDMVSAPVPDPAEVVADLWAAIDGFDSGRASTILDAALRGLALDTVLDEVAVPLLRRLGDTWRESDRAIAREHLGSQLLRARLFDRLRELSAPSRGRLVACCPRGEHHDLGTLMASVRLAADGWQARFLGVHTPPSVLAAVVRDVRPRLLLVGAQLVRPAREFLHGLRVGIDAAVVLGGTGFAQAMPPTSGRMARFEGPYAALPSLAASLTIGGEQQRSATTG